MQVAAVPRKNTGDRSEKLKIIKVRVDWHFLFANGPSLHVLFNRLPSPTDYVEIIKPKKAGSYYIGVDGPFLQCFSYASRGSNAFGMNTGGLSGNVVEIEMRGGEKYNLIGPWISNSGNINQVLEQTEANFRLMEICYTADEGTWQRGFTFSTGYINVQALIEYMDSDIVFEHIGIACADRKRDDSPWYVTISSALGFQYNRFNNPEGEFPCSNFVKPPKGLHKTTYYPAACRYMLAREKELEDERKILEEIKADNDRRTD